MHGVPVVLWGFHGAEHLIGALHYLLGEIVAAHLLENGGGVALAVVCNGCTVFGKLERCENAVCLSDSCLQGIADDPLLSGVVIVVCLVRHIAGFLINLDTGAFAETEVSCILLHLIYAQIVADTVEEDVAGITQSLGDIVAAVGKV